MCYYLVQPIAYDTNIGIKHGFSCITFARSRGRYWKPRPEAAVFNTSLGTWRMFMHWKTMFDRYCCIKTENICYISRYFLHYFVSPFHQCLANTISTDYAHSRARQYISRNGSKSGPWYDHIESCVADNARLLITRGIAFYAIMCIYVTCAAVMNCSYLNQVICQFYYLQVHVSYSVGGLECF